MVLCRGDSFLLSHLSVLLVVISASWSDYFGVPGAPLEDSYRSVDGPNRLGPGLCVELRISVARNCSGFSRRWRGLDPVWDHSCVQRSSLCLGLSRWTLSGQEVSCQPKGVESRFLVNIGGNPPSRVTQQKRPAGSLPQAHTSQAISQGCHHISKRRPSAKVRL